jgi:hypothetical protein
MKFSPEFSKLILDALARLEKAHDMPLLPVGYVHLILSTGATLTAPVEAIEEIRRRDPQAEIINRRFTKHESRAFKELHRLTVAREEE